MPSDYPRVSVVISTYDRPNRLATALDSVYHQTFTDFEVIVVDDCSPDKETMHRLLEEWYDKFLGRGIQMHAIRLGENSGYQCMPKNKGIEFASQMRVQEDGSVSGGGDYIAYLDDDNTWRPEHLAVCIEAIESDFSSDMVYTRLCYHADDATVAEFKAKGVELPIGDADGVQWNPNLLSQRNYIDTSTIMHSKGAFWRLVRDSGYGWDETLRRFGDWNLVWRWGVQGNTAKLVDKVTVDYNWHANGLQLSRPAVEVPICLNFAQYQSLRADRNRELASVS